MSSSREVLVSFNLFLFPSFVWLDCRESSQEDVLGVREDSNGLETGTGHEQDTEGREGATSGLRRIYLLSHSFTSPRS